ncbi:hypothetical protein GCM10009854_07060 [Saccharopolyspora halophila]|uniref:Uncharacterized protein n=1 Tax=Saccharopolyspora halophila TaxID=405551 RepID=A0ABP5SLH8_9PSEU
MSGQNAQAALRMREVQWALDDAAHRMPRGEVPDSELENLADRLSALAQMVRPEEAPEVVEGGAVPAVEQ